MPSSTLRNFLWFSDIALVAHGARALAREQPARKHDHGRVLLRTCSGSQGTSGGCLTGKRLAGLTDYMFDVQKPLYLRALSLFHVFLPVCCSG